MEIDNGVIIPSHLRASSSLDNEIIAHADVNNLSLRAGLVLKAYDINHPSNVNRVYTEYDVQVIQADGKEAPNKRTYRHVIIGSLFGGVADYMRWAPRIEPYNKENKINYGSRVLLLCLNGNTQKAYIIGGLPHPSGAPDASFVEQGFKLEQNGVNVSINKDGEFVLIHKGATKSDGTVIDKTNGNSTVSMTKDGLMTIGYTTSEGDKPQITWDKTNNTLTLHATSKIRIEANGGPVEIQTKDGVKINSADEAFVRGTTYREKQNLLNQSLSQLLEVLSTLAKSAAGALIANSPTTAGPIVSSMGDVFLQMQSAINSFENASDEYLSKKHFHED